VADSAPEAYRPGRADQRDAARAPLKAAWHRL